MAHFTVTAPTLSHADEMARVHVQGWKEAYSGLLPSQFYGDDGLLRRRRMWTSILSREAIPDRLRVATSADTVIGIAWAGPPSGSDPARELELHLIYITSDHYGSGAGQALLDAVLGREPAQLWVAEENPRAIAFYRRNGFAPDGERKIDADLNNLAEIRLVR